MPTLSQSIVAFARCTYACLLLMSRVSLFQMRFSSLCRCFSKMEQIIKAKERWTKKYKQGVEQGILMNMLLNVLYVYIAEI